MPTSADRFDAVPKPTLSDEAVVYIHEALENYLHLFQNQYGNQLCRYYDERSEHQMPPQPRNPKNTDPTDEPF